MDEQRTALIARKNALRTRVIAARRTRSTADRAAAAAANEALLSELLIGVTVVCAYLPLAGEPLTAGMLGRLADAGVTVLVPVVRADAPLDWCRHPGPTEVGAFGIAEPTGPRLGAAAVRTAEAILVPALAVDQVGRRLGRGGGHYDRTLQLLPARHSSDRRPELIAVLFAGELVSEVPAEDHDQRVDVAVLAQHGIRRFTS